MPLLRSITLKLYVSSGKITYTHRKVVFIKRISSNIFFPYILNIDKFPCLINSKNEMEMVSADDN